MQPERIIISVSEWERMTAMAKYAEILEKRLSNQQMQMGEWAGTLRATVFALRQAERMLARHHLLQRDKEELLISIREAELQIELTIR